MTGSPSIHPGMQRRTAILDGGRLQELRRERGLSQEQLATVAGISLTTYRAELSQRALRQLGDFPVKAFDALIDALIEALTDVTWAG
jgi:transcriptional regulator with XRE-family HTH domain